MKNIYLLAALILLHVSCSKSGNDDAGITTITITNQYDLPLSNVLIAKMGPDAKLTLIVNLGSIEKGAATEADITASSLTNAYLFYEYKEAGVMATFQVKSPYPISAGQNNAISVDRSTETKRVDKNSASYPGGTTITNPPPTGSGPCGTYNGKPLHKGPDGGCYYLNSSGKKSYVDRSYCGC